MKNQLMYEQILAPKPKPLVVDGFVYYSEKSRAKDTIRLKKEIIREFGDLKRKNKLIKYKLEYCRGPKRLRKRIKEITNNGDGIPFLLFIYSEENGNGYSK